MLDTDNVDAVQTAAGLSLGIDVNKLTRVFLKIREARAQLKKEFDAKDGELKEQQEQVGNSLLNFLNTVNVNSSRTDHGVFYRQECIQPSAADWDTVYRWVKENDGFDFLEKRLKKTAIAEYMKEHNGEAPPGVNVYRGYEIRVRKD